MGHPRPQEVGLNGLGVRKKLQTFEFLLFGFVVL